MNLPLRSATFAVLALMLAGCGSGEAPTFTVRGKVTLDGEPVGGGSVAYLPDAADAKYTPTAAIQPDGSYTLTTNGKSGAPAGDYKVTVTTNVPTATPYTGKPVPPKYGVAASTPLKKTVTSGSAENTYDLELSSKK